MAWQVTQVPAIPGSRPHIGAGKHEEGLAFRRAQGNTPNPRQELNPHRKPALFLLWPQTWDTVNKTSLLSRPPVLLPQGW